MIFSFHSNFSISSLLALYYYWRWCGQKIRMNGNMMNKHLEKDSNRIQNNNDLQIDAKNSQTKYESVGLYLSMYVICSVPMSSKQCVDLSVANSEIEMEINSSTVRTRQRKKFQRKNSNSKHVWQTGLMVQYSMKSDFLKIIFKIGCFDGK